MTRTEKLKTLVRRIVAGILFWSGLNTLYRCLARKNCAVVLAYHRVIDRKELKGYHLQPGMYVTQETFEIQMEYLSKRYHVISVTELIETLRTGNRLRPNTCVITFDDGWGDTYTHALPILRTYGLPATIFLVSDYVGTSRWFWHERVSFLAGKYFETLPYLQYRPAMCPGLESIAFRRVALLERLSPAQKVDAIIASMKDLSEEDRERVVRELKDLLKMDVEVECAVPSLLDWEEIVEMQRFNITVGSHTKSHKILIKTPESAVAEEVAQSRETIQSKLSRPCLAFCYPDGAHNEGIRRLVMEHYRCAFTMQSGFVGPNDDLFALKRVAVHDDITFTKAMFACRISGVLELFRL